MLLESSNSQLFLLFHLYCIVKLWTEVKLSIAIMKWLEIFGGRSLRSMSSPRWKYGWTCIQQVLIHTFGSSVTINSDPIDSQRSSCMDVNFVAPCIQPYSYFHCWLNGKRTIETQQAQLSVVNTLQSSFCVKHLSPEGCTVRLKVLVHLSDSTIYGMLPP